ncbi:Type I restriction-modification system, specificity subunit S [Lunatimonas lonarensis]|uniref:Type I restriction-modification system, specificity subunit S n=1 Tax=Lunatimonas lonarensis TaxID=1232681 RepID=R7ZS14_9BACT|nr:restriction endonuclease subunit S [Lunatimonas lonarensis]EON76838.1 Type I restriction-modification system, specificity subunit S [Lunatimonas lonarensis]
MSMAWKVVEIEEVCNEIVDCLNRTAPKVDYVTPFKMIRTSNVRHGRIDLDNVFYVDEPTYKKWTRRLVPKKGDIILTREAPLGEVGLLKTNELVFLGQRTVLYRSNEMVCDGRFLYYSLISPFSQASIKAFGSGSTVEHMKVPDSKKIKLKLPPLPTQRKIAAILSAYDDLIENNLRRIKLLEEKAKLTYEEWFVRMKFPGYESTPINEETGLPEGWERIELINICSFIGRGISPKYVENDGISVINQKCIRNNRIDTELCRFTCNSKKISPDKLVKPFDILVNSTGTGTLGRVAQMISPKNKITVDSHVTIVRAKEKISNIFLGRLLELNQPLIEKMGKGSTNQIELSKIDLGNLQITLPSKHLQEKFEKDFKPNFLIIEDLLAQNQLLKEARDILLPRLMTGMIDVDALDLSAFGLEEREEMMVAAEPEARYSTKIPKMN